MELKTRFIVLVEVLCIIATNWTIRHYKLQIESWFWLVVFGRTVALVKLFLEHFQPEDKLLFLLWRHVLNELTDFSKWIMWETFGFVYPLMVITILEKQQLLSEEDAMLMQSIFLAMEIIFNLLAMSEDNMRFVVAPHQLFAGVALSVHLLNSLDIQDPVVAILSVIFLFGSVVAWGVAENEKMDDMVRLGAKFGYTLAFGVCSVLFGQQIVVESETY